MADKDQLIYPIVFDIDAGIEQARKDFDRKQAQFDKMFKVNLNFNISAKSLDSLAEVQNRLKELKLEPITPATKDAIQTLTAELKGLETILKRIDALNVSTSSQRARIAATDALTAQRQAAAEKNRQQALTAQARTQATLSREARQALRDEKLLEAAKIRTAIAQERLLRAKRSDILSTREQTKEYRNLAGVLNGLPQFLNSYLSVLGGARIVDNIRRITGEFELQRISLAAIVQDTQRANELFQQTLALSIESPFTAKELLSYTKQLAAYRIETDELYDTTKKLADISAGLGVDMSRLILAYGQVKAAAVLRGCLARGTEVMLYNGDVKNVEDVVEGDVLVGDDDGPRNVIELIRGKDSMVRVIPEKGKGYKVNRDHIFTFLDIEKEKLVDITLSYYFAEPERYLGVRRKDGIFRTCRVDMEIEGVNDYYGFVIDGNRRFLLADGTVTHNTELRQFTEAGIPLVELLADKFSLLRGEVVSTAEVFDLISTRQVPFEMVSEIFDDMTKKGGIFYDMQKKQSNTLYGIYQKLGDALQQSFAKLGDESMWALRAPAEGALLLMRNWEGVRDAITAAITAFGVYKTASLVQAAILGRENKELLRSVMLKKQQSAESLVQASAYRELTLEEKRQVAGAKTLTNADLERLVTSRALTKDAALRLIATKRLTAAHAEYLVNQGLITNAEAARAASTKRLTVLYRMLGYQISLVAKRFASMALTLAKNPVTWIVAAVGVFSKMSERAKELKEQMTDISTASKDMALDLKTNYEKLAQDVGAGLAGNLETGRMEAVNASLEKILSKNRDIAPIVKDRLKDVTDEVAKMQILKALYEDIMSALEDGGRTAQEFAEAMSDTGSAFFNRTGLENVESFNVQIQDITSGMYRFNRESADSSVRTRELYADWVDFTKEVEKGQVGLLDVAESVGKFRKEWANAAGDAALFDRLSSRILKAKKDFDTFAEGIKKARPDVKWDMEDLGLDPDAFGQLQTEFTVALNQWMNNLPDELAAYKSQFQKYFWDLFPQLKPSDLAKGVTGGFSTEDDGGGAGADPRIQALKNEVAMVKEAYAQYEKLRKTLGDTDAAKVVSEAYREIFEDFVYASKAVPVSVEDVAESLNKALRSQDFLEAADAAKVKMDIVEFDLKGVREKLQAQLDELGRDISRQQTANEFFEKILGFTGDADLAANLSLNIYGMSSDSLREKIVSRIQTAFNDLDVDITLKPDTNLDLVQKKIDGLSEEQRTVLQPLLDDYRKYQADIVSSLYSQLGKYDEFEKKRLTIINQSYATERKIRESALSDIEKRNMLAASKSKRDKDLAGLGFDEFRNSDAYIAMFENLEKASESSLTMIRNRLEELRGSLGDALDPTQLKDLASRMEKIDEQLRERNPFRSMIESIEEYRRVSAQAGDAEGAAGAASASWLESLDVLTAKREEYIAAMDELNRAEQTGDAEKILTAKMAVESAKSELEAQKLVTDEMEKQAGKAAETADAQRASLVKIREAIRNQAEDVGSLQDAFNGVKTIVEAIAGDLEDTAAGDVINGISTGLTVVTAALSAISAILVVIEAGLAPILVVALAVAAAFATFTALSNIGVRKANKEIEKQAALLEDLESKYRKLERAAEDALGTDWLEANLEMQKNLEMQIQAVERQKGAELLKGKKSDSEKIKEYNQQLEELGESIEDLQKSVVEAMTGTSLTDMATELAQTWLDAYLSFSDTMDAMGEKFREMMQNMVVNSILAKVVQAKLKSLFDYIDYIYSEDSEGNVEATVNELKKLYGMIPGILESTDEDLTAIMENLKEAGLNLSDTRGELSGISKEVGSLSEETGISIAAAINSQLYYLAGLSSEVMAIRRAVDRLAGTQTMGAADIQNLAYLELVGIRANTLRSAMAAERLVTLLGSVVSPSGVRGPNSINVNA